MDEDYGYKFLRLPKLDKLESIEDIFGNDSVFYL